jgi:hypothetical protein
MAPSAAPNNAVDGSPLRLVNTSYRHFTPVPLNNGVTGRWAAAIERGTGQGNLFLKVLNF